MPHRDPVARIARQRARRAEQRAARELAQRIAHAPAQQPGPPAALPLARYGARCPRCSAEVRYHRAGVPVALCGWPLAPCATRMPSALERAMRPRRRSAQATTEEAA